MSTLLVYLKIVAEVHTAFSHAIIFSYINSHSQPDSSVKQGANESRIVRKRSTRREYVKRL